MTKASYEYVFLIRRAKAYYVEPAPQTQSCMPLGLPMCQGFQLASAFVHEFRLITSNNRITVVEARALALLG